MWEKILYFNKKLFKQTTLKYEQKKEIIDEMVKTTHRS